MIIVFRLGKCIPLSIWVTDVIDNALHGPNEDKYGSKYFVLAAQISLATLKDLSVLMTSLSSEAPLPIDDFLLVYCMFKLTQNQNN